MPNWKRLMVDGTEYRVRIVYNTLARAFELIEGPNAGDMLSGRHERDLIGTGISYQMQIQPDPLYPADYDALYEVLSDPTPSHTVVMPYGQTTITYEAEIQSGEDVYDGVLSGVNQWRNLTVNFRYISPQKEAD